MLKKTSETLDRNVTDTVEFYPRSLDPNLQTRSKGTWKAFQDDDVIRTLDLGLNSLNQEYSNWASRMIHNLAKLGSTSVSTCNISWYTYMYVLMFNFTDATSNTYLHM